MLPLSQSTWPLRGATFGVWALAAACAVYWGLKLSAPSGGGGVAPVAPVAVAVDSDAVARALGGAQARAEPASPSLASRFALQGVVAGHAVGGAALIAVDGKPAKTFRVGNTVDADLVLQSVAPRRVSLGTSLGGPATLTLDMPPLVKAGG